MKSIRYIMYFVLMSMTMSLLAQENAQAVPKLKYPCLSWNFELLQDSSAGKVLPCGHLLPAGNCAG